MYRHLLFWYLILHLPYSFFSILCVIDTPSEIIEILGCSATDSWIAIYFHKRFYWEWHAMWGTKPVLPYFEVSEPTLVSNPIFNSKLQPMVDEVIVPVEERYIKVVDVPYRLRSQPYSAAIYDEIRMGGIS